MFDWKFGKTGKLFTFFPVPTVGRKIHLDGRLSFWLPFTAATIEFIFIWVAKKFRIQIDVTI